MYKVDIFTDKLEYASFAMIDGNQNIELDYLAFDAYTIETRLIECKKGYFVHITEDNEFVCDGIVSDVKPDKATQQISIKPLQTMFDEEVFYSPVTDAITWLATNIKNTYLNNADTYQNRPINLTYTTYSESFPLTGFNLHETINILSVMISALKTHGVVVDCSLDLPNKHIKVDIHKSDTDPFHIRADLDNVIESSVTLGDSYGSKNKAEIQKTKTVDDETTYHGITNFYLHNDGSIDSTDSNRVWPVFRSIENLQQDDDMTDQDWLDAALARAKEILEPQKYDNEIMLTYSKYDKLIHPNDIPIGREVIIYLKGNTYASVLTGKRIKGNEITLIFGVVRTEFTKKLSIEEREKLTFQNTVSAVIAEADDRYVSSNVGSSPKIGDVIITSTNTDPSSRYGGTWELIDKEFTPSYSQNREVAINTTNCSACSVWASMIGHQIEIEIQVTVKVAVADTTLQMCTLTPANFGVTAWTHNRRWAQISDNGQAFVAWHQNPSGGMEIEDAWTINTSVTRSIPAGTQLSFTSLVCNVNYGSMLDSWCNKFYWKRLT